MLLPILTVLCCFAWTWLLWGQGNFWHLVLPRPLPVQPAYWPEVAIIVPARDEAAMLPKTLPSLLAQNYPGNWRILVVDDHSTDGTAASAQSLAAARGAVDRLQIIQPPTLPAGWSGKVHAMHCGVQAAGSVEYILFTDADILHQPNSLRFLVARAMYDQLDLHSMMVKLHCRSIWEKLLIPAYVYFFQMLYPFHWSNTPGMQVAAAAGGVMLVYRPALEAIGGLESIKGKIIDDCALARAIKFRPNVTPPRTLITLVHHEVVSLREYSSLMEIWRMVARTAFTQLYHSWLLLIAAIATLALVFLLPLYLPALGHLYTLTGFVLLSGMLYSYLPLISFYRINFLWAAALPIAAMIFMGATVDSAFRYAFGRGGQWKGRAQAHLPPTVSPPVSEDPASAPPAVPKP